MTSAESAANKQSYAQIFRSTALIGGASLVNIAFSIIRGKAIALMLGPAGVGLMGLYIAIVELTQSLSGLGVQSSGVRQIAEAVGIGESQRIANTAAVLKRTAVVLGVVGAILLILMAESISEFTFGSDQHTIAVGFLAAAVLLRSMASGWEALIQGMRRISDLARISMLTGLSSTMISIVLIYFFRERGIVALLVAMAGVSAFLTWWYSRKVQVPASSLAISDTWPEVTSLLKLGVAFMASGVLTLGAAYAVRTLVLRHVGSDGAGFYQAAWALASLYTQVLLQALATDFYPRLTAAAKDHLEINRLVNEQAHVSVLLAVPGVIATMTFAPLIMTLFYSAEFQAATNLLRWLCLGMVLRVMSWPMGFIVLAKGAQGVFFWTELAATIIHVGSAWLLVSYIGLDGAGMAFFILYAWHSLLIYVVVRHLSGFRLSASNRRIGLIFLPLIAAVYCGFLLLPFWPATALGSAALLFSSLFSARKLIEVFPPDLIPATIRRRFGQPS